MQFRPTFDHPLLTFLFIATLLGAVSLILFDPVSGESTFIVDQGGEGDFLTVQDAVNASEAGDTIRIFDGTYLEHVVVNTSLSILGNGTSSCVIDAGGDGVALEVGHTNVTIRGITFTGGGCCKGAGLKVKNAEATISEINCTGNLMGGLHLINATVSVTNSAFWNNSYGMLGFLLHDSHISNSSFERNGFGLYIIESHWNHFIQLNVSRSEHMGMFIQSSSNSTVDRSILRNNPYGISLDLTNLIDIVGCEITRNKNGIFLLDSCFATSITGSMIHNNTDFGIDSTPMGDIEVLARFNWWGDDTGPYHRWLHPGGKGDTFAGSIKFYPWTGDYFMEPWVDIHSPGNGSTVNGTVRIIGSSEDVDGYLVQLQVSSDGSTWENTTTATVWDYYWNTTLLPNGSHSIWFRGYDGTYHSAIVTLNFNVKNEPADNGTNGNGGGNGTDGGDAPEETGGGLHIGIFALIFLLIVTLLILWPKYKKGRSQ